MKYLITFYLILHFSQMSAQEKLMVQWPADQKWKMASERTEDATQISEWISGSETLTKWTIMGSILRINDAPDVSPEDFMEILLDRSKETALDPISEVLEKDQGGKWILFKVEASQFVDDPVPESQLYYILSGKGTIHVAMVAIKKVAMPKDFQIKWARVFRNSKIITK